MSRSYNDLLSLCKTIQAIHNDSVMYLLIPSSSTLFYRYQSQGVSAMHYWPLHTGRIHKILLTTSHSLCALSYWPLHTCCTHTVLLTNSTQVGLHTVLFHTGGCTKSYWQLHTGWIHTVLFHTGGCTKSYWQLHTGWIHTVLLTTPHRLDAHSLTDNSTQVGCT